MHEAPFVGTKKLIQVELVKLPLVSHLLDAVGQLVGHHHHLGQRLVRVRLSLRFGVGVPFLLRPLLVRVGPVVNLFLDELARADGPKGCARQVEVGTGGERHQFLVVEFTAVQFLAVGSILRHQFAHLHRTSQLLHVLLVVEVLGMLAPCAIVILVQHDAVPLHLLNPLVGRLDATSRIASQHILEGSKAHEGLSFVHPIELRILPFLAELPALKVPMRQQVLLPCCLHRRLEGEHQEPPPAHAQCQLIGGEGLAKTHLGVPEEVRNQLGRPRLSCPSSSLFLPIEGLEVFSRFLHSRPLFGAHGKSFRALQHRLAPGLHRLDGTFHIADGAAEPLALGVVETSPTQHPMHRMVVERSAVRLHGRAHQHDFVFQMSRSALFRHPLLSGSHGVAHLQQPAMRRHLGQFVSIDGRLPLHSGL